MGRRKEFTSVEKLTRDNVVSRKEEALANCSPNEQENNRHSDLSGWHYSGNYFCSHNDVSVIFVDDKFYL